MDGNNRRVCENNKIFLGEFYPVTVFLNIALVRHIYALNTSHLKQSYLKQKRNSLVIVHHVNQITIKNLLTQKYVVSKRLPNVTHTVII